MLKELLKKPLKISVFIIIYFLMVPVTGSALGLGNITVYSKLNEPLKVHIELINRGSIHIDDIVVKNANRNTYKRANLPRPTAFNKILFAVKQITSSTTIVELTTKKPVREPFITFIADLKWRKGGHINREYTFLLDPPEFVQKQMRHRSDRSASQKKSIVKAEPRNKKSRKTPRATTHRKIDYSTVVANHIDGDTYKTKRADTLWEIAKKVKPGNKVSTYQTMQALFALNPDAFINNNINLLKQGQTLNIPTQNEILQINGKAPLTQSATTNKSAEKSALTKQKVGQKVRQKTSPKTQSEGNDKQSASTQKTPENKAQLKIIPTNEVLFNSPVTSKDDLILINRALKNSISTIKSLQNENDELSKKISLLTKKLVKLDGHNQNLNEKITEISVQLEDKEQLSAPQLEQSDASSTNTKNNNSPAEKTASTAVISNTLEVDSTIAPAGKSRSFIRELITSPVIAFALAIFIIIILVATLFALRGQNKKRKQKNQNPFVPYPNDHDKTQRLFSESGISSKDPTKEFAPTTLQGTDIGDEKDEEDMDFFEYFEKKINAPDDTLNKENEDTSELSFNLEIDDAEIEAYEESIAKPQNINNALSEIDTYIAYGNYIEAEKSLLKELKNSPSNSSLHMKLFECYTYSNKRFEFISHAEKNIKLLNSDRVLHHRIESIYQQTWNEPLKLN